MIMYNCGFVGTILVVDVEAIECGIKKQIEKNWENEFLLKITSKSKQSELNQN